LIPYAEILEEKIQLTQKVLQELMPHAMKGDFERYLADASIFMEFFSLIIVAWTWLEIGTKAQEGLNNNTSKFSDDFYLGKIETLKYFYAYELPKTLGQAETLLNPSTVTIKKEFEYLN